MLLMVFGEDGQCCRWSLVKVNNVAEGHPWRWLTLQLFTDVGCHDCRFFCWMCSMLQMFTITCVSFVVVHWCRRSMLMMVINYDVCLLKMLNVQEILSSRYLKFNIFVSLLYMCWWSLRCRYYLLDRCSLFVDVIHCRWCSLL
jgi:hypothetical protein